MSKVFIIVQNASWTIQVFPRRVNNTDKTTLCKRYRYNHRANVLLVQLEKGRGKEKEREDSFTDRRWNTPRATPTQTRFPFRGPLITHAKQIYRKALSSRHVKIMYLPRSAPHCSRRCTTVINYGNSIVLSLFPARRKALYRVTLYVKRPDSTEPPMKRVITLFFSLLLLLLE